MVVMNHLKSIEKDRKAFADAVNALGELSKMAVITE